MGLFKNSHFLFFCDKLIHQPALHFRLRLCCFEKVIWISFSLPHWEPDLCPCCGWQLRESNFWRRINCLWDLLSLLCLAVSSGINSFCLSHTHKKSARAHTQTHTRKLNSTAKKAFSFLILDLFWSPGGFCYPTWRIEHWLRPRFALQPQPPWTSLLGRVLFMKRNYLNPQEQEVSSLYFFLDFQ